MSNLTLNGFADFVSKQNPNEELNHWAGFSGCAIGAYVQQENPDMSTWISNPVFHNTCVEFSDTLPNKLRTILVDADEADNYAPTYGKLNEFLQEFV